MTASPAKTRYVPRSRAAQTPARAAAEIVPQPRGKTERLPDYLRRNLGFIRQCHQNNMTSVEIVAKMGLNMSKSSAYKTFSNYRLGRSHLGFAPIVEVKHRERREAFEAFKARSVPQGSENNRQHIINNREVIIEMHRADFYLNDIADILSANIHSLSVRLKEAGITRKALDLPRLRARQRKQSYKAFKPREWSSREDAHIRRGHACGFLVTAVGALCRRSGREIQLRAADLGLGPWQVENNPRRRQVLAQDYDAKHDSQILEDPAACNRNRDHAGLPKDASSLK